MTATKTRFSLDSQEEVFFSSTATSRAVRGLLRDGRIRQVAGRLYTKNLDEPLEAVVRRRAWTVAAGIFPGAVIVDRTAFEARPSDPEGSVFLCSDTSRVVRLPGLVLNCRRGPGPVAGDTPFVGEALYLSSWPRRFLDNVRRSRARSGVRRTLSRAELEAQLERLLANAGEDELNRLREEAAATAPLIDRESEAEQLSGLIGALLGTMDTALVSPLGRATQAGGGWDEARLVLFDSLFAALNQHIPIERPAPERISPSFSFYEAYFSNFIEGTEFTVEEARAIVFEGAIPADRTQDAHDVLGTFDLVSDPGLRDRTPTDTGDLLSLLSTFHARIMSGRPDQRPGHFKAKPNRAGNTVFVAPSRVRGTLERGYERYHALPPGFARAVFAMFLVAEVHPFSDGNGRVARALANAELTAAGQRRLMIPIVFRDDYLQALRAMSRLQSPTSLIRALSRAQDWTGGIDWASMASAEIDLERTHALLTPMEAEERGVILRTTSELSGRASLSPNPTSVE
ncbi:MAG TPA: Fic family protein [Solirubrobacteraceae bacterium]|nr:Fic family protein [Solirubrobacteraceae bacterium]